MVQEVSELSFCKPAAKSFCEMAAIVSGVGVKFENMPSQLKPVSLASIKSSRNLLVGSAGYVYVCASGEALGRCILGGKSKK